MSVIHKCDRCRNTSEERLFTTELYVPVPGKIDSTGNGGRKYDLCVDCLTALRAWMATKPAQLDGEIQQGTSVALGRL